MAGYTLEELQRMGAKPIAATPLTPQLLQGQTESSTFTPQPTQKGLRLEDLMQSGARQVNIQATPTPTAQPVPLYATGDVQEVSPLTFKQRALFQTPRSDEGRANVLRNFGFEPLRGPD